MRIRKSLDYDTLADEFGEPSRKTRRFKKDTRTVHKRSDGLRTVRKHAAAGLII